MCWGARSCWLLFSPLTDGRPRHQTVNSFLRATHQGNGRTEFTLIRVTPGPQDRHPVLLLLRPLGGKEIPGGSPVTVTTCFLGLKVLPRAAGWGGQCGHARNLDTRSPSPRWGRDKEPHSRVIFLRPRQDREAVMFPHLGPAPTAKPVSWTCFWVRNLGAMQTSPARHPPGPTISRSFSCPPESCLPLPSPS